MLPALIGLGVGLIGGIGKMIGRGKANREMEKLIGQNPVYTENPLAKQRLGLAQTLLNARMPGSVQAERNIYSNQANQLGVLNRNSTDASQAIAAASGIGGQTNDSFTNLGAAEAQDYQRRLGNLNNAQEGVIQEQDKVFNDQTRRYGDLVSIRGAQNENRQNNWGDISNMGFGVANFGLSGGFNGLFGGGGASGSRLGNINPSNFNFKR